MELIDKAAVVAEIERRRDAALTRQKNLESIGQETVLNEMIANELNRVLSFIDTLEVMEADAEIVEVEDNNNSMYAYTHLEICTDEDLSKICKAGDKAKVIIIKQK